MYFNKKPQFIMHTYKSESCALAEMTNQLHKSPRASPPCNAMWVQYWDTCESSFFASLDLHQG